MKIKRLFSVIGLGLFAMAAAGAGVLAAKGNKAEPAKAEGEWMFRVQFVSKESGLWEENDAISNVRFHFWGDGEVDTTVNLGQCAQYRDGSAVYGTNIVLGASQTVNGGQFIFAQEGKGQSNCYSLDLSYCTFSASDTDNRVREWFYSDVSWTDVGGGQYKWTAIYSGSTDAPEVKMTDMANLAFTPNPAKNRWEAKNWEFEENEKSLSQRFLKFDLGPTDYSVSMLTKESKDEFGSDGADYSACWYRLPDYGTHDFFLEAVTSGDGQMVIKKHGSIDTVNIYYVLENDTPTTDYIYSWGGSEQFGAWPGTQITSVVGVEEVTNNTILKFQGNSRLIYKIPVKTGYPSGDEQFKFNNGSSVESEARPISGHNAYWWSGDANSNAGYSLEFLLQLESIRNAVAAEESVKAYSVCGISKENAISLVNTYNSLGSDMQETYIDCSTIYTYKGKDSDDQQDTSVRKIIEQLGIIAGVEPSGANFVSYKNDVRFDSTAIIIIVCVAVVSVSSLSLLLVIKRRKQN